MLYETTLESPIGPLRIIASDAGIRAVLWPKEPEGRVRLDEPVRPAGEHPIARATARQLTEYFAGERTEFDLPLDPTGTEFQQACWSALRRIPYGATAGYAEQAAMIGKPTAARAVGAADGRNPISIIVPCHRVVASDGSLTGFAGGLEIKRWLLDHEAEHRGPRV